MKFFKTAFILLTVLPFIGASQTTLTSLSPSRFYTQSSPITMSMDIEGKNIWPDGWTLNNTIDRIKVYFKKGDKQGEITGRNGISTNTKGIYFSSEDWAKTPGTIEVFLIMDGKRTNSLWLTIEQSPKAAPVITSLSDYSFKTGEKPDVYYIRIYGKNFGEESSTYATIGSLGASAGWQSLQDGVMDVWVPGEYINKPGTYPVTVTTAQGTSNSMNLKIEAPPVAKLLPGKNLNTVSVKPVNNNLRFAIKRDKASMQVVKGIKVKLGGTVAFGENKSQLEKFISGLDNVFFVDDQLDVTGSNGNISVSIQGKLIGKTYLENIKDQIRNKLASMKLSGTVVIE